MDKSHNSHLLTVNNLRTNFYTDDGVVRAVDGVSFYVNKGEVLGLVGESGCGKSVTSFSIINLVDEPGKIEDGNVFFEGKDLHNLDEKNLTKIRGNQISMIFQQPLTSLNPVFSIGEQISEVFSIHMKNLKKQELRDKTVSMLRIVGIPDPESKIDAYPHQISGGQAQRVMIAMALALRPKLLIADEPTTALDVTIQAQILDLLRELQEEFDTAIILITHDLGVISEMADRVAVMYAGAIVEEADVNTLFNNQLHPYTKGLMESVPVLGKRKDKLDTIPGNVPNLIDMQPGCRFASRCVFREKYNLEQCENIEPDLIKIKDQQQKVRCWLYQDFRGNPAPLTDQVEK